MLFPNIDAEKTVAVDYSYMYANDPSQPATWQRRTVFGELLQVQPPGSAFGPPVGTGRWWVRLSRSTDPALVPGSVQVMGVRGASLHTRVAWLEGKRMRFRERATLLTREDTR